MGTVPGTISRGHTILYDYHRWVFVRLANSKARIKPTAPLLAFDKENSIEFLFDFLLYLYTYLTLTLY